MNVSLASGSGEGLLRRFLRRNVTGLIGLALMAGVVAVAVSLATWTVEDPSLSNAIDRDAQNYLGYPGAVIADLVMQFLGIAAPVLLLPLVVWGWRLLAGAPARFRRLSALTWLASVVLATMAAGTLPIPAAWPLPTGLGGVSGDLLLQLPGTFASITGVVGGLVGAAFALASAILMLNALGVGRPQRRPAAPAKSKPGHKPRRAAEPAPAPRAPRKRVEIVEDSFDDEDEERGPGRLAVMVGALTHTAYSLGGMARRGATAAAGRIADMRERRAEAAAAAASARREPSVGGADGDDDQPDAGYAHGYGQDYGQDDGHDYDMPSGNWEPDHAGYDPVAEAYDPDVAAYDEEAPWEEEAAAAPPPPAPAVRKAAPAPQPAAPAAGRKGRQAPRGRQAPERFELPALELLAAPKSTKGQPSVSPQALEENARLLESVLDDFGVRGQIIHVRPGPVVTLYELEPAPGIKSSRVIGLADDIARSMSAIACRVAVIPGKNAIGIELPNERRQTVFLRELMAAPDFSENKARLPLCLGKTIGGEPVIADLARMPHLLIAGTTGSGKSVSVNTMILSLLYRLTPAECRLIMIDPKMLELSTYDGIPHLLTPVVTDPGKAVVALKWTVREMEDRYRKMSKVGVRNIDGLNARIAQAKARGETLGRNLHMGFDPESGEPIIEREELALEPMPYIVVIIDEMADLMMVAGKDIEGAVQRLAQMARAAGIHVVMATQRPSVDVITGTIKANFPTRISFQVTSKIDSRTILGEQGAEQLLGQGDMLYMMGGGRIQRVHGPFVSDEEVDGIVAYLKTQGTPDYLEAITAEPEDPDSPVDQFAEGGEESNDLYDKAVAVVLQDRKASTSYIQRRLQIGYNRAASLIERMEKEGVVGRANHAGKREILVENQQQY